MFVITDSIGCIITNNDPISSSIPNSFKLGQNYPNPFNPTTRINYSVPVSGLVNLQIFDITGRLIQTLVNEVKNPGSYIVEFNANTLSSGTYFYRLEGHNFVETKKMLLIK